MSDVVNLNRFRKKKRRGEKETTAAQNREKFGQPKAEKAIQKAERDKRAQHIDGHKMSKDDD